MSIQATHPYESGLDKNAANYLPLTPIGFLLRSASVYPGRLARMSSLMTVRGAADRMLEGWAPRPGRRRTQGREP